MALIPDISNGSINKGDPDKQIEALTKQINEATRLISNEDITKVYKDDSGVGRVLLGKGANGFQGIRVSQAGSEVYTASDDELVMSSDFNVFKIVASGTATVTLANPVTHFSTTTTTVTHDLGYKPAFKVFCTVDASLGGELIGAPYTGFDGTGAFAFSIKVGVTDTTIVFGVQPNAASAYDGTSWVFKYYLVRETAN